MIELEMGLPKGGINLAGVEGTSSMVDWKNSR